MKFQKVSNSFKKFQKVNLLESGAILELMPDANRLVLIHMKRIAGIVVLVEKRDKGERFGKLIHCALRAVEVYATNAT